MCIPGDIDKQNTSGHDGIITINDESRTHKYYDYETKSLKEVALQKGDIVEIIAFSPNQIKSAEDNNGNFSAENDSILFQEATEEEFNQIVANVKHTPQRQDYIKRYYTDKKGLYETKTFTSQNGKITGEIEVAKDRNLKRQSTKNEIDCLLKIGSMGNTVTLLSENMTIGDEPHIDALINKNTLVELKTLTGNANSIAKQIQDGINKGNSEIVTVFLLDKAQSVDDNEIQKLVDLKNKSGYIKGNTNGVFVFRNDKISQIKVTGEKQKLLTPIDSTLPQNAENVNSEDAFLFQTGYHGSAADFDKFDTEHFGFSGEGAMAFGYGTYISGSKEIAKGYARADVNRKSYNNVIEVARSKEPELFALKDKKISEINEVEREGTRLRKLLYSKEVELTEAKKELKNAKETDVNKLKEECATKQKEYDEIGKKLAEFNNEWYGYSDAVDDKGKIDKLHNEARELEDKCNKIIKEVKQPLLNISNFESSIKQYSKTLIFFENKERKFDREINKLNREILKSSDQKEIDEKNEKKQSLIKEKTDVLETVNYYKQIIDECKNGIEKNIKQAGQLFKSRNLYTVDIPDDGFLKWDEAVDEKTKNDIKNAIFNELLKQDEYKGTEKNLKPELDDVFESEMDGVSLYNTLGEYLGGQKQASDFLHSLGYSGIQYLAQHGTGGKNGDIYNYVIFNDDDAEITEHIYFQTEQELFNDAKSFDDWHDFMEYYEEENGKPDVSLVPEYVDARWYETTWRAAIADKTLEETQNEKKNTIPTSTEDAEILKDVEFERLLFGDRKNKGKLEDFLKEINYILESDVICYHKNEFFNTTNTHKNYTNKILLIVYKVR